jgi:hypothetical protein
VRHVKWSRKGREIKVYEAAEKVIVFLPVKENPEAPILLMKHLKDIPENLERQEVPRLSWS